MSVTVTFAEGTFVFVGTNQDGSSRWQWLRPRRKDGRMVPGRVPQRVQRLLKRKRK